MSFILDALKKSEVERQRQAIPGLMDSRPVPTRAGFPLWAAALIALLAVNVVVLAVVLTRGGAHVGAWAERSAAAQPATTPPPGALPGASTPAASPGSPLSRVSPPLDARRAPAGSASIPAAAGVPATAGAAAASGAGAADHFSPMDPAPPVYAPEIPAAQEVAPAALARRSSRSGTGGGAGSGASGGASGARVGSTHHAHEAEAAPAASDDPADNEVLPSINEINLAAQPALEQLHLDVHVYATKPADRFVYINMRKYREGATLAEGPLLERIRRDGVVLNYQGLRFVLPRQQ